MLFEKLDDIIKDKTRVSITREEATDLSQDNFMDLVPDSFSVFWSVQMSS